MYPLGDGAFFVEIVVVLLTFGESSYTSFRHYLCLATVSNSPGCSQTLLAVPETYLSYVHLPFSPRQSAVDDGDKRLGFFDGHRIRRRQYV